MQNLSTDYDIILERLQQIDPVSYARTRNFINGAVTYLSPYISRGIISTMQVKEAVLKKGYKRFEIEKFLQELAWREYYQRIWQAKKELIWQELKQPQQDVSHHQMITAIQNAATGITAIDEQVNNLYTTGYMHNHIRMYVAAIACNMAKAHWLQPSKWLYYHLLDGDIASNNCSWQWVAGAFAAKKYYCNQENINRYTLSTQQHTFLDQSYEAIAAMTVPGILQQSGVLQLQTALPSTTLPAIDCNKPTLLYNAYNLDPLWRRKDDVNRVLLLEPSHYSRYPVSEKVITFIISLSKNIPGIQVYCGELSTLQDLYTETNLSPDRAFIAKEHPAFDHYPGIKDSRDWMYPSVTGFYPSFFSYWKQCERWLE
ncbi:cryptochrome/DNA photolyase family protein [Ferruginibacter profundus]